MEKAGVIRKLDEVVINRIAAGEVIQRPHNALKEMIENSLDAKATSIQIVVHGGGMKYLHIQDNGTGIRFEDLEILCERFTTSKLREFDDLLSISTYGFRGEALASISHVAHVSILTKTVDSPYAYKAIYLDGKLQGAPKPSAGNQGTKIIVEDLFYNVPTRRQGLKSASEEFSRIYDIVKKYSIHNNKVSFSLKKQSESNTEYYSPIGSTAQTNIQLAYGSAIAKELIEISHEDNSLKFKLYGQITNANYQAKRFEFILFINGRLVECSSLKKMIEAVYSSYLATHSSPFVYLSLEIPSRFIDVNCHPTKETVEFLNEIIVYEKIREIINEQLLNCQSSRTYKMQVLMPSDIKINKPSSSPAVYQSEMVRTDKNEQKIDKFFNSSKVPSIADSPSSSKRNITLTSVLELRSDIENNCHKDLVELFKNHVFVGTLYSEKLLFIQYATKLYMCDIQCISLQFFYQLFVYEFGNFGVIRFETPISIREATLLALNSEESGWAESHGPKEDLSENMTEFLKEKATMLNDYFSIEIDQDGNLHTLPLVLDKYIPDLSGLPMFLVRMAADVEWDSEKECFHTLSKELAKFYSNVQLDTINSEDKCNDDEPGPSTSADKDASEDDMEEKSYRWTIENILCCALRSSFQPNKEISDSGSVIEIANLQKLYRIFERC